MQNYEIEDNALEAMERFAADNHDPIVMVNLMNLREQAVYPPDSGFTNCSGRAAMKRYEEGSAEVRRVSGARLIWGGFVKQIAIAPTEESWDRVVLVRYPSATAYLTMRATSEYQSARLHRRAALRDSRLYMTVGWD